MRRQVSFLFRKATVSAQGDLRHTVAPLSSSDDIHVRTAEVLHVSTPPPLTLTHLNSHSLNNVI